MDMYKVICCCISALGTLGFFIVSMVNYKKANKLEEAARKDKIVKGNYRFRSDRARRCLCMTFYMLAGTIIAILKNLQA